LRYWQAAASAVPTPSGAARYGPCVDRVRLPGPRLVVDGRSLGCSTRLAYAGAYQLTIWTIVPELATELHSSYLGHPKGHTIVAHLQLRPGEPPVTLASEQAGAELPVREARPRSVDRVEVGRLDGLTVAHAGSDPAEGPNSSGRVPI
jgi:hypothetical protein